MEEFRKSKVFGDPYKSWEEGKAKTVTFIVTQDCQLACKYCYMIKKNTGGKMTFSVARKVIDYLLYDRDMFPEKSIIWEFVGGEPFLEVALINKICDYIKIRTYELNHPWFNNYRFSFSTNGLLYNNEAVQLFIKKNRKHVDIGISIDGTRNKHDLNRIYKNGKGCYDDLITVIPLWLEQFPYASTKVTVASEDISYISESILHLWDIGIRNINCNVVFENVWIEGDEDLFEHELKKLADIIISKKLYLKNTCSLFSRGLGKPLHPINDNQNWCGAGRMLAVDHKGFFYPCIRYCSYSLKHKKPVIIGNVDEGINKNKLRPFEALNRISQSPAECIHCKVASGCAWCQAVNYDCSSTGTNFQRATYICKMHKARVRANNYFWEKLDRKNANTDN